VDDDIDGVNDSGNTTDTFGGDYRAPEQNAKMEDFSIMN
jgi:hypothetical protein